MAKLNIEQHFWNNFKFYMIVIIFFVAGILIGAVANIYINNHEKQEISNFVMGFFSSSHGSTNSLDLLKASALNNLKIMAFIWILGASVLGFPLIICVSIYSGFSLGFCTSFFISKFNLKGFLFILVTVFPENIIKIPCIIAACVIALKFSIRILDNFVINKNKKNLEPVIPIGQYSISFLVLSFVICISSLYDAYIVPMLIKIPMFKF